MMRDSYTRSAHEVYIRSPHHFKEPGHLLEPDDPADLWRIDVPAKKILWRRNLRQQLYHAGYPQAEVFIPKYCHMESYLHYAIVFGCSNANDPWYYINYLDYAPFAPFVARIDTTDGRLLDWRFLPGEWYGSEPGDYNTPKWDYWYPYDAGTLYAYATADWPHIYVYRNKNELYEYSGSWRYRYWDQMLVLGTDDLATLSVIDMTEPFEHPYDTGLYVSPAIYDWCADKDGIYWTQDYLDWEDKPGAPGEIQSVGGIKSRGFSTSGPPINIRYTLKQIADACGFSEGYYWNNQYPQTLYGVSLYPGGNGYPVMTANVSYWETAWGWELGNTVSRMVLIRFDVGIWKTWCLGSNPEPRGSSGGSLEYSLHKSHPFCSAWVYTQPIREEEDPEGWTNESRGIWLYKQDLSDATKLLGPDWYEYWADFEGYCWQSLTHFRVCRPPNSYEPGTPVEIVGAWKLDGELIWNNLLGHDGPFFPNTDVKAIASVNVHEAVIAGELLSQSEE